MSTNWDLIERVRKERSKRRSAERKAALKKPPTHHMMFLECTNQELLSLLKNLFNKKLSKNMSEEIDEQYLRKGGPETRSEHFDMLTRNDLLMLIYSILADEIRRIDEATIEEVGLLINETWSCPQLADRVNWRFRNAV
jgi:hypothetical protein